MPIHDSLPKSADRLTRMTYRFFQLLLTMGLSGIGASAQAQIPVTDAANLAFQRTMQQAMQLLMQNTIAESAIKEHLGNTILRDQIGQRLLAPMLEQLSIKTGVDFSRVTQGMTSRISQGQQGWNSRKFGMLQTGTKQALEKASPALETVQRYYGFDTTPNCPDRQGPIRNYCLASREILATQLLEIENLGKTLEARNLALQDMMADNQYGTLAELQQKQYTLQTLQALIANDQMRLQTSMAAYQGMRTLYQEKYQEALQNRVTGKPSLLGSLSQAATVKLGLQAGKLAARELVGHKVMFRK